MPHLTKHCLAARYRYWSWVSCIPANVRRWNFVFFLLLFCHSVAADPPKTGAFRLQQNLNQLLGASAASSYESMIPANELIQWEVYVPPTYDASRPAGLMVYISPTASGKIPKSWRPLMNQHNLIWVAARRSGNKIDTQRRMIYAVLSVALINKNYKINSKRIYLSGFSGGGRVASMLGVHYPMLFRGGIYNCGANFWGESSPQNIDQLKRNRFVFITGRKDFNLEDTKKVYRAYKRAGIRNSLLSVSPIMGHKNPNKKMFDHAIKFLDGIPLKQ